MKKIAFIFIFATVPGWAIVDPQADKMQEANELYKKKKYAEANKIYQQLKKSKRSRRNREIARFNAGNSLYQQQKYKQALDEFYQAAQSSDPQIRSQALNNLGNTYAKLGEKNKALQSYLSALNANKENKDIRRNIERLTRKKPPQQQKQQQNQKQNQPQQQEKQQQSQQQANKQEQRKPEKSQGQEIKEEDSEAKERARQLINEASRNKVKRQLPRSKGSNNEKPY